MKISLGCGRKPEKGWIGLDLEDYGHNRLWEAPGDLNIGNGSVEKAKAHCFLEHLTHAEVYDVLREVYRVLVPGGTLDVIVPDMERDLQSAIADPTHKSCWCKETFQYLCGKRPQNASYHYPAFELELVEDHGGSAIHAILKKPNA